MENKEFDPMNIKHEYDPTQKYKLDPYNMKIYTKEQYVQDCLGGLPNVDMLEAQWEKLPDANIGYDSMADTLKHIKRVSTLLNEAGMELIRRGNVHDESKLSGVEKEGFDKWTPLLAGAKYGSDEYKNFLTELKASLDHHYDKNSHHPEHTFATEEWRVSHIFPDVIQVSNLGRIKRLEYTVKRKTQGNFIKPEQILTSHVTPKGYMRVQLSYNGEMQNVFVHTLVATVFLGAAPSIKHQVNHKDGNKLNNVPSNFEWSLPGENLQHSYDIELRDGAQRKYIVHCVELDITTIGTTKMEKQLRALGYKKARSTSILACIYGTSSHHLDLHFEATLLKDAKEQNSGLMGFDLFDLIEMFFDWKAATERTKQGNIYSSIEYNRERFQISDQICNILINTADRMGYEKPEDNEQ